MAKRYNPLAPLAPKALNRMARQYAQAQFGPVLSQINKEYANRARAGTSAIASSTNQLAAALAPAAAQTHQIYGQAQSAQSAIDSAIAAKLTGAGQSVAADVGGQLAAAGQSAAPTNLAQIGAGAGSAAFGLGSAAQSRLVAEGAARENYAAGLPNIARLGGLETGREFGLQLESGRQSALGDIRSKIPGTVAQIQQDLGNREFQKAVALQSGLLDQAGLQEKNAQFNAKFNQRNREFAATQQYKLAQARVDQYYKDANLQISKGRLDIAARNQLRLERAKKGQKGGYTPSQISKFRATAIDTVKDWKHGVEGSTYADGSVKSKGIKGRPNDPRGAFRYLVNHGIPPSLADWAVGNVYGKWKAPGERSRRGPSNAGPR